MAVAEAECQEGEPHEEGEPVHQWTAYDAARDAEQRTVGSYDSKQDSYEHDKIDGNIAKETGLTDCLSEGEQALLYCTQEHEAAEDKHHQTAVKRVGSVTA